MFMDMEFEVGKESPVVGTHADVAVPMVDKDRY